MTGKPASLKLCDTIQRGRRENLISLRPLSVIGKATPASAITLPIPEQKLRAQQH